MQAVWAGTRVLTCGQQMLAGLMIYGSSRSVPLYLLAVSGFAVAHFFRSGEWWGGRKREGGKDIRDDGVPLLIIIQWKYYHYDSHQYASVRNFESTFLFPRRMTIDSTEHYEPVGRALPLINPSKQLKLNAGLGRCHHADMTFWGIFLDHLEYTIGLFYKTCCALKPAKIASPLVPYPEQRHVYIYIRDPHKSHIFPTYYWQSPPFFFPVFVQHLRNPKSDQNNQLVAFCSCSSYKKFTRNFQLSCQCPQSPGRFVQEVRSLRV